MVISAYQVNNVLRVYKGQLRQGKMSERAHTHDTPLQDMISISSEAKRKVILDKIATDAFERITFNGSGEAIEKKAFEKLETEYGSRLSVTEKNPNEILFKEIDEEGETIHSLSLEDSQFLSHKLKEITKEMLDDNIY